MKNALADSDKRGGQQHQPSYLELFMVMSLWSWAVIVIHFSHFERPTSTVTEKLSSKILFFFYKKLILKLALPSCSVGSGNTAMTLLSLSFLWVWENDPWGGACLHLQHDSCWDSLKSPTFVHSIRIGQPLLSEFMWLWKRKSTRKPVAPFIMWRKWNQ